MDWDELKTLAEEFLEKGAENLQRDDRLVPTYFMVTHRGVAVIPIEKGLDTPRDKRAAAMAIRKIAAKQAAMAVLLITEGHYSLHSSSDAAAGAAILPVEMPAGTPDTFAALSVSLGLPDGRNNLLLGKVVRNAGGRAIGLEERAWTFSEPQRDLPVPVVLPWEPGAPRTLH